MGFLGVCFQVGGITPKTHTHTQKLDKIPSRESISEKSAEPAAESTPKVATEPTSKVKTEAIPTKLKKSRLKLKEEFMNEIIADEKDTNNEIFLNYFKYQNPSFL